MTLSQKRTCPQLDFLTVLQNVEVSEGRFSVVPALLKFTSFLTIVAMVLFQIPVTCGIIQSVSFPFEIQLRPQTKYVMPGHFSLISGSSYQFCPDRFLAPVYHKEIHKKSIFNSSMNQNILIWMSQQKPQHQKNKDHFTDNGRWRSWKQDFVEPL